MEYREEGRCYEGKEYVGLKGRLVGGLMWDVIREGTA